MLDVIIGTTIHFMGAYVLDKFLFNQKQIQKEYPSSGLCIATCEYDLVKQLENFLVSWGLNGTVIFYEVVKPKYAQSHLWNIASGREVIRRYALSQRDTSFLLFLDADMIYEPSIINIMMEEIHSYDAIFSGYKLREYGTGLAGFGCVMLTRQLLERITIRCYEFQNGEVIFEDNVLEMDLFLTGSRVKKGFFLSIEHYMDAENSKCINPHPVGLFEKITNNALTRYFLIWASIKLRYNIPWKIKVFFYKLKRRPNIR